MAFMLLSATASAQVFTNNIVDYGDGSSNVFSTLQIGPDGKIYCMWKDGSTAGIAGASGPATYKLIRWNTATSAWDSIGSFAYTDPGGINTTFGIGDDIPFDIDSAGGFHVAFIVPPASPLGNAVYYAYSANGTSWAFTQLVNFTATNDSPGSLDLFVDPSNRPHVFFKESNVGTGGGPPWTSRVWTIWHYFHNGTAWQSEPAYSQNGGSGTSPNEINNIACTLDSNGKGHVVFCNEINGGGTDAGVAYVTNAGGSWSALQQLATGATGAAEGLNVSIVTDAANKVHIIRRGVDFKMHYHTNVSGSFTDTWMNGNLLGNIKTAGRPLTINSIGDIFCAYNGQTVSAGGNPGIVRYACLFGGTGSTWQIGDVMTTSPANTRTGQFISAAFTSSRLAMTTFDHYTDPMSTGGNPAYTPVNNPRQLQYATATVLPAGGGSVAPTVTTATQSAVTHNSATLGGNVTADGGASVTERGIVWSTSANPTTADTKVANGSGTGVFSATVNGLPSNTTVHVRAYAINSVNTSYGADISFTTLVAPAPEIAVSGNGQNIADGDVTPATADDTDFGSVPVQGVSVTHTFTIANSGTANLTLGTVGLSGTGAAHFSVTQPLSTTVAPSSSTTFTVTYDPSVAASHTATVTFTNNDSDENPFNFDVQGTGTGPRTFDLAGNPVSNTPFDTGETYIYSAGPPPPLPVSGPGGSDVVTGSPATDGTGAADGTQFDQLQRSGFIAENGTLAFLGYLQIGSGSPAVTLSNYMGYWKTSGSSLTRIARQGFDAPETGATAAKFNVLPLIPGINDDGQVTLMASLLQSGASTPATTAANDLGIWSELGGTGFQILIREDDTIPGLGGPKVDTLGYGCFATTKTSATTGEAAFITGMKNGSTDTALLRTSVVSSDTTAVGVIARENTAAPGGGGENFNAMLAGFSGSVRMDATGNVVFASWLKPSNKFGIWYQDQATKTVSKTVLAGETAPGTTATFQSVDLPNMGGGGTYAFRGVLNADGDNATNAKNDGIWKGTATAAPALILRRGDNNTNRPGLFTGAILTANPSIKAGNIYNGWLTNANHGAWLGWVDLAGDGISSFPADTFGVYTDASGTMTLLTASGQPAPGIAGANFFFIDHPVCGGTEQVAFLATVTGGGTSSGVNDKGVWRTASSGGALTLVLRTGDTMSVTVNGVPATKTIADVDIPGSGYADHIWETPVMDGTGRLLIFVTFTDGSTTQVLVP